MAVSLIALLRERSRQASGDTHYADRGSWLFRLVGPPNKGPLGPNGVATFPMVLPPERFSYQLPFATQIQAQQGGGVVVDRGGMVLGSISMTATTGFALRKQTMIANPVKGQFTGGLGDHGKLGVDASGQLAFFQLASRCFEGYAQLVADPETAAETRMELHIFKDDLHLEVEPLSFHLNRSAGAERVTYRFEVELRVLGQAIGKVEPPVQERGLLDSLAYGIAKMREAVQSIGATLNDLTAAVDALTRQCASITGVIDDLGAVVRAGTAVVDAGQALFDLPQSVLASASNGVADAAAFFENLPGRSAYEVAHSLRRTQSDLDVLTVTAAKWHAETFEGRAQRYNAATTATPGSDVDAATQADIDLAASTAAAAGGALSVDQVFDSPYRPGDAARQLSAQPDRRVKPTATSGYQQVTLTAGDTLQSLAAKYMGDGQRWIEIAVANDLSYPYVTEGAKLPGTRAPGDAVVIPVPAATASGVLQTGPGNADTLSPAEVALGTDLALVTVGRDQVDLQIDVASGGTDAALVRGIDALGQGLVTRLSTERGSWALYPNFGVPLFDSSLVGQDAAVEAMLRVRQQIASDRRVESINAVRLELDGDVLALDLTVKPIRFDGTRQISRTLG